MKKLNPKSLIRLSAVVCMSAVALSVTLFTSSCQKEDSVGYDENKWDAYEYLDISDEAAVSDMIKWSEADMEALRQADARMTFKRGKDGLLFIEEKSAKEVNISPKLFAFSQRIVDNTNRFILDKALKKNRIPLSKSSSTEGDDGECSTGTDCVAQTISAVLAIFKVNISAAEINKKLEAKYGVGKGVPVSKFTEEVMGYLKGEETTLSSIPSKYRLKGNSSEVYLLGLNVANMGGHAATLISIEGDWLTVKDDQNNRELKIHKEEVLKVYKATGVQ